MPPGPQPKKYVKAMQMVIGCDLIGSKMSMASNKNITLTVIKGEGIEMHSKSSGRTVCIPFTNIKGYELLPEAK